MIAIVPIKLGPIILGCCGSQPTLALRLWNVLEKQKFQKTPGFQTSYLGPSASKIFAATGSFNSARWVSKANRSLWQGIRDFSTPSSLRRDLEEDHVSPIINTACTRRRFKYIKRN